MIRTTIAAAAKPENETCERCSGKGSYSWGTVTNGVPAHTGECFRCKGKGFQTPADRRRNRYYDNHVMRVYP
jgi:hypothetical protein